MTSVQRPEVQQPEVQRREMQQPEPRRAEVLLIGGRSGVGKTSAALALHEMLALDDVQHAVIEGDLLDLAHPAPWAGGHDLAEQNLAAIWANYRAIGYHRLVYTNTVSVIGWRSLAEAMGGDPVVIRVLLRATDARAAERLRSREAGAALERHLVRSADAARRLDDAVAEEAAAAGSATSAAAAAAETAISSAGGASPAVAVIDTDELTPHDVATRLRAVTGW